MSTTNGSGRRRTGTIRLDRPDRSDGGSAVGSTTGERSKGLITLAHGSGGRLTYDLVKGLFCRHFSNPALDLLSDSAVLDSPVGSMAFTTDGFVVSPLFFPGGDIGSLAVCGTVNDLVVAGAVPLWLSAAFFLEEGLPIGELERIVQSMAAKAAASGVKIVTGDTKVVDKGHGDGVFIATAGVGRLHASAPVGSASVAPGDLVLVSGPIGDHGAVIAALRAGLDPGGLTSDCAPLTPLGAAIAQAGVRPKLLRDPTRGGLATLLAEVAKDAMVSIELAESQLPVRDSVRGVCDLLGLDPLYLPCEGRLVALVEAAQVDAVLGALRRIPDGADATVVGRVVDADVGPVVLRTRYGGRRLYDTLAAEQLPRIC
ncbi:MAG: hydrogenase expression/formation protein HypE [Pseudomonadota bacterium]